jgi:hypothetical protein
LGTKVDWSAAAAAAASNIIVDAIVVDVVEIHGHEIVAAPIVVIGCSSTIPFCIQQGVIDTLVQTRSSILWSIQSGCFLVLITDTTNR